MHETVRVCYHKIKEVIKPPKNKKRRLIAINEAITKVKNKQTYI